MPRDLLKLLAKPENWKIVRLTEETNQFPSYQLVLTVLLFGMGCEAACIRVLSPMRECSCKKRCCSCWSTEARHVEEA